LSYFLTTFLIGDPHFDFWKIIYSDRFDLVCDDTNSVSDVSDTEEVIKVQKVNFDKKDLDFINF